jgi:hypothetical protein
LTLALEALKERSIKKKRPYYRALDHLRQKAGPPTEVGRELGLSEFDVKNLIRQARVYLSAEILRLIQTYSSSPEEFADERRVLWRYLRGTHGE